MSSSGAGVVLMSKSLSLPFLNARPLSTGAKPLSAFLGDDGFPIMTPLAAQGVADAKKSVAAGSEIDTLLEQSRNLRDQFARKREALMKEYRDAERDAEKQLHAGKKATQGTQGATRCVLWGWGRGAGGMVAFFWLCWCNSPSHSYSGGPPHTPHPTAPRCVPTVIRHAVVSHEALLRVGVPCERMSSFVVGRDGCVPKGDIKQKCFPVGKA